jgi:ACT domain-containing protein
VYVANEFNKRIQKFDSNGHFITEFGQDRLDHPIDVAVVLMGSVFDSDLDEILIFVPTLLLLQLVIQYGKSTSDNH